MPGWLLVMRSSSWLVMGCNLKVDVALSTCCVLSIRCKWPAGTFHSVGCQIVRRHVRQLGDTGRHNFAIFDQDDSKAVMKKALKQHFRLQTADFADSIPEAGAADEDASSETAVLQEWVSMGITHRMMQLMHSNVANCSEILDSGLS